MQRKPPQLVGLGRTLRRPTILPLWPPNEATHAQIVPSHVFTLSAWQINERRTRELPPSPAAPLGATVDFVFPRV